MEIYADVMFLINFTSSYLMLMLTGRIIRSKPKAKRLIFASALGGILSVLCFFSERFGIIIKISGSVILVLAAFGKRYIVIRSIIFLTLSSLVLAAFMLISSVFRSETVILKNGTAYFDIPLLMFVTVLVSAYALILIISEIIKRRKMLKIHTLKITLGDKSVCVRALLDSGNTLKEPVSGKSVIIAEWQSIEPLFDGMDYNRLLNFTDRYRLRIVPYHSLGNKNGIIVAFLADDITVLTENRSAGRLYIGITREQLSRTNDYSALMGASV